MAVATERGKPIDPAPKKAIDPKLIEEELKPYEAHGQVFTQITGLYSLMLSIVGVYVLITAGTWAYEASGAASELALAGAAIFHLLVSSVTAAICFGIATTILQRFEFLERLGDSQWDTLMGIGRDSAEAVGRWGFGIKRQTEIWWTIPALGAVAGLVLVATIYASAPSRPVGCDERRSAVEAAASQVDLDRAIFLYREAGCVRGGQIVHERLPG